MAIIDDRKLSELRERAKHCRRLALGAMSWSVADQLDSLAAECDREASQLIRSQQLATGAAEIEGESLGRSC